MDSWPSHVHERGFFVDFECIRTASGLDIVSRPLAASSRGDDPRETPRGTRHRRRHTQARSRKCFGKRDVDEMRRDLGKVFDIPFNSKNKYQARLGVRRDVSRTVDLWRPFIDLSSFLYDAVPRRRRITDGMRSDAGMLWRGGGLGRRRHIHMSAIRTASRAGHAPRLLSTQYHESSDNDRVYMKGAPGDH